MSGKNWDETFSVLPDAHFLQTSEWAEVKKEVGWHACQFLWKDDLEHVIGAANLLTRTIKPFGIGPTITIGYIPRGPMFDWQDKKLVHRAFTEIEQYCRQNGLIFVKIDPELVMGRGIPGSENDRINYHYESIANDLQTRGWRLSSEQIQFKNTAVLDLNGSEEDWLKRMKQKARYNLRLAQRSGVIVRRATDEELPLLYKMYTQTATRDGFIIREMEYYLRVWRLFMQSKMAEALIAEVEGEPVAGLVLFHLGRRAWYFYGMSTALHREKMPNYLLQWEAMRLAKEKGCNEYDLWGAPDTFNQQDRMYGVFRFKDGLGAEVIRTSGAWDFVNKPFLYWVYQNGLPLIQSITRMLRGQRLSREARQSVK